MMICGRDSNTSSALGNQFIANVPLCQMPTASTAVLEARQPRSRAKWEAPTLQQLLWNQLARANLVRFARIPCLLHPCAGSTL